MSEANGDEHDEWAYKVYGVDFNRDDTITALIGYARAEDGDLQMTPAIETMLLMFGRCARCGFNLDGFDSHQKCMWAAGREWHFIPVVVPKTLYQHLDKERRREYVRDKSRVASAARKVLLDAIGERHSKPEISALYVFQGGRCYYCYSALVDGDGAHRFTKDHLTAVANGGGDGISNIVLCCRPCNSRKLALAYGVFRRQQLELATPDDRLALIDLHRRHKKKYNPPKKLSVNSKLSFRAAHHAATGRMHGNAQAGGLVGGDR